MTPDPACCTPETPLEQIAKMMAQSDCGGGVVRRVGWSWSRLKDRPGPPGVDDCVAGPLRCAPCGRGRRELLRQALRVKRAGGKGSHVPNGASRLAITYLSFRGCRVAGVIAAGQRGAIVADSLPRRLGVAAGSVAQRGDLSLRTMTLEGLAGLCCFRLAGPVAGSAIRQPRSPRTRPAAGLRRRRAVPGTGRWCWGRRHPRCRRAGSRASDSPSWLRR